MRARMRITVATGTTALAFALVAAGLCSPAMARQPAQAPFVHVCSHALPHGVAGCDAIRLMHPAANWHGTHLPEASADAGPGAGKGPGNHPGKGPGKEEQTLPAGYGPLELRSAYGLDELSLTGGFERTVAIVDAYDDPSAEADMNVYRSKNGLGECTQEDGCLEKVNQEGEAGNYPKANSSWSEEISLDLDMVSAICPNCKILLVEASSASLEDLGTAAAYAAENADAVSNSYGAAEFSAETSYDRYYAHNGVAVTVSAGDSGYGAEYPAASPYVTAIGGTTLRKAGSSEHGWSETVWSGTGAGCSAVEPKPAWQPVTTECANRTVADTSADANPETGVAVYDTEGQSGWLVFGGTSVASLIAASVYALAGNTGQFTISEGASDAARGLYGAELNPVSEGYDLNPHRCRGSYLCSAEGSLEDWSFLEGIGLPGGWFNGPTGNGTPDGTAGF